MKSVAIPSASSRDPSVPCARPRYSAVTSPTGAASCPLAARRKARHHPLQIARRNRNVRVIDQQKIVPRMRRQLHQRAHLAVGSQPLRALHQPDRPLRKLAPSTAPRPPPPDRPATKPRTASQTRPHSSAGNGCGTHPSSRGPAPSAISECSRRAQTPPAARAARCR